MRKTAFIAAFVILSACASKKIKPSELSDGFGGTRDLAHQFVYKQKADYSNKLPVGLSAGKDTILSYPGPKDVLQDTAILYPVKLFKDYWWDRIGVGTNTGYVDIELPQYTLLKEPPALEFLSSKLLEKEPYLEIWDCGTKGAITIKEVNDMIMQDSLFKKCKKIMPF